MSPRYAREIVRTARRHVERGVEVPIDIVSELNLLVMTRGIPVEVRQEAEDILQLESNA